MRPSSLSRFSNPAWRASRVAIAAGTLAGLATLGACADSASKSIAGPREAIIDAGALANPGKVTLCVAGLPAAQSATFTTSILGYGGSGSAADNAQTTSPNPNPTILTGACKDVLVKALTSSPSDNYSQIGITYASNTASYVRDVVNCVIDLGYPSPGGVTPCDNTSNVTTAIANAEHGVVITYNFVAPAVVGLIPLFVIGDIEPHGIGAIVNFWGSQWWKNNPMSLQSTRGWPSFKGFAGVVDLNDRSLGPCGSWVSRVGNSPPPPATIPSVIALIVANKVFKFGPGEGGGIQQIVVVTQDGGYGPNPGHDGNGVVTSIQCP